MSIDYWNCAIFLSNSYQMKCKGIATNNKSYSLRPTKSVVLAFKFCPTKSVILACNEIYLIKVVSSTKKALHRKMHRANQIFSRYYFSSSNA